MENLNKVKVFSNAEFGEIRAVEINGEPWLVGKDVAAALGYERATKAIQDHVDEEDRDAVPIQDSIGRMQNTPVINESGVYSLVLSSKLPGAKKFKRWVTSEVLPSIRKHGAYIEPDTLENMIASPEFGIRLLTALKEERDKNQQLRSENAQQRQLIEQYEPKASYYDIVLQTPDVVSINKIAKDYGRSARWMNQFLHDKGVQYKQGNIWLLYQKYAGLGYTKSRTNTYADQRGQDHSVMGTYWTQKGRLFIYDLLKKEGIIPLIEMEDVS